MNLLAQTSIQLQSLITSFETYLWKAYSERPKMKPKSPVNYYVNDFVSYQQYKAYGNKIK